MVHKLAYLSTEAPYRLEISDKTIETFIYDIKTNYSRAHTFCGFVVRKGIKHVF